MSLNITEFEKELRDLIRKYGFTKNTEITDSILTLYLIACMRQYITNVNVKDQPCWCKDWLKL